MKPKQGKTVAKLVTNENKYFRDQRKEMTCRKSTNITMPTRFRKIYIDDKLQACRHARLILTDLLEKSLYIAKVFQMKDPSNTYKVNLNTALRAYQLIVA